VKHQATNLALNSMKTIACHSHAKCLFETILHAFVRH